MSGGKNETKIIHAATLKFPQATASLQTHCHATATRGLATFLSNDVEQVSQLTVTRGSIACQFKPSSALTVGGPWFIHTSVITPAIVAVTLIDV